MLSCNRTSMCALSSPPDRKVESTHTDHLDFQWDLLRSCQRSQSCEILKNTVVNISTLFLWSQGRLPGVTGRHLPFRGLLRAVFCLENKKVKAKGLRTVELVKFATVTGVGWKRPESLRILSSFVASILDANFAFLVTGARGYKSRESCTWARTYNQLELPEPEPPHSIYRKTIRFPFVGWVVSLWQSRSDSNGDSQPIRIVYPKPTAIAHTNSRRHKASETPCRKLQAN